MFVANRKPRSLKTWLAVWAYIASVIYHDSFWYPFRGQPRVHRVLKSKWGRLFHNWESTEPDERGYPTIGPEPAGLTRSTWRLFGLAMRILLTCIREAPERRVRRPGGPSL